ncbi:Sec23/Sec24 zinc finger domain-containing protein [Cryptosporidium muris RN66]|uniref:Sec23/Sec24 zinc finger domain-containing protein n=1 Tax=Cryptosporidium muris (strain RN66) TaxID=441375 RepID=B6AAW0_CRYMR|nr:Sec23/Sec24 zinc finger domain-containing protein [Cryptosporidium muris RN66]EEA05512.1 Sec23/Sec24 zinc finger domain-containing protein [Cryptosporidium muris RN66]|eukprot:XP_002139861.1 Sec23/Sec24 zinc finger domain-containing protein [Cryptosporidium muris RN66]
MRMTQNYVAYSASQQLNSQVGPNTSNVQPMSSTSSPTLRTINQQTTQYSGYSAGTVMQSHGTATQYKYENADLINSSEYGATTQTGQSTNTVNSLSTNTNYNNKSIQPPNSMGTYPSYNLSGEDTNYSKITATSNCNSQLDTNNGRNLANSQNYTQQSVGMPLSYGSSSSNLSYAQSVSMLSNNVSNQISDLYNQVSTLIKSIQTRVDPAQIPRPIYGNITEDECKIYESDKYILPPLSLYESFIQILDRGNSTCNFFRLTLNQIPSQHSILQSMRLPFSVIIQPFPHLPDFAEPIPVVNTSSNIDPVRCLRCKAYINSFTTVSSDGNQCVCNFCGHIFEIPLDYLRVLQSQFRSQVQTCSNVPQIDENYPELSYGVVDYFAPASLGVPINPDLPSYCFVIEASLLAVQYGITGTVLYCLKYLFSQLAASCPDIHISLILFSKDLMLFPLQKRNFKDFENLDEYDISSNSAKCGLFSTRMCVVTDIQEPFMPCPIQELSIPIGENIEFLSDILDRIPELIQSHSTNYSAYFSAISLASQIMAAKNTGGTIFTFCSSAPNIGIASINTKDITAGPKSPPRRTSKGLKYSCGFVSGYIVQNMQQLDNIIQYCRNNNTSVESFILSPTIYDGSKVINNILSCSTLAYIPQHTGGKIRLLSNFSAPKNYQDLYQTLYNIFMIQPIAYDCTFKLRCSRGIAISKVYAPWTAGSSTPDLSAFQIPKIDSHTSIAFILRHEESLDQIKTVYLQAACLYTCKNKKQRMLRVLTLSVPVTTSITTAFRYASVEPLINLYTRMAAHHIISKGQRDLTNTSNSVVSNLTFTSNQSPGSILKSWRQETLNSIIEMLFAYRENCANTSSSGQLILPDSLKLVLVYTSSIFKNPALMPLNTVLEYSLDEQIVGLHTLLYASVGYTSAHLYPRLYSFHHSILTGTPELQQLESLGLPYELTMSNSNSSMYLKLTRFWLNSSLPCSGERVFSDGIYILEDGVNIYIYIGSQVSSNVIREIFNVDFITKENIDTLEVPTNINESNNTTIASRLSNIIYQIRMDRSNIANHLPIKLVSSVTELNEARFKHLLIEDAIGCESSYVDFLCNVHKLVQNKLVES